ncbi:MAG TPA: uracil-DNA glycosylase family protein [Allosphingosinicella sp.]|nr:uracil-DNA glycosylase family protein [Allosphingosinicella sp.]
MRGQDERAGGWAASALGWWQEAGVDTIVGEEPRDWLAPKTKATDAPPSAPPPDALPDTLEGFRAWLAETDQLPYAAPGARRAAPAGDPAAGLMILTDMPSADGGLISGEAGALLDKMLAAIGRRRETIYLAALSPVRTPAGTIGEAEAARLAELARHHIGLAAPKALLLFGDACGKALVGSAVAAARARWHDVQTGAGPIRTLVTLRPEKLLTQPKLKALAWADLQMLMEELA